MRQHPPKRFKWLKRFAFLFVLLALLTFFAPLIAGKFLKDNLIASNTKDLNGKLVVGELSLGWLSEPTLKNVTLKDNQGKTVANISQITVKKTLLALLKDHSHLGTIEILKPELTLELKDKTTNVEDVLKKYLDSESTSKDTRGGLDLKVIEGTLRILAPGVDRNFENVNANVAISTKTADPIVLDASLQDSNCKLTLQGEVGSKGKITFDSDKLPADFLGPLIQRFEPSLMAKGTITAKGVVGWGADGIIIKANISSPTLSVTSPRIGTDTLTLSGIQAPIDFTLVGDIITTKATSLACDIGRVDIAGTVNLSGDVTTQGGLTAKADIDLTMLATRLPQLVKLKPGTELNGGKLTASLESVALANGVQWKGSITTSDIKGKREGRTLTWDSPLRATFAAKLDKHGLPDFEILQIQSDFVALAAKGTTENFVAAANIDLNRLATRLADFVDLDGMKLEGLGRAELRNTTKPDGSFQLTGNINLERFSISDQNNKGIQEPQLIINLSGQGKRVAKSFQLDSGTLGINAGSDTAEATLTESIADVATVRTGAARVALSGDLNKWRARVSPFVTVPPEWTLIGNARVTANMAFKNDMIQATNANAEIINARLRIAGVAIEDNRIQLVTDAEYDLKTTGISLTQTTLTSQTVTAKADRTKIAFAADGTPDIRSTGSITGSLFKIQQMLALATDPTGADRLHGEANGTYRISTIKGIVAFETDIAAASVSLGNPSKPTWTESKVSLYAKGEWDAPRDALRITNARADIDGLSVSTKGAITRLASTQEISFDGNITYDLAKVEPKLKQYLGAGAEAKGKDTKPFSVKGSLSDAGNVAVRVGTDTSTLARFQGNAAVGWQKVKAYGFDVGPSEMRADLNAGLVKFDPIRATFGEGKIQLEPTLALNTPGYDLTFKTGRVIDRARLTPAACADALGYALPVIAKAAQSEGTISMDLDNAKVPLKDYNRANVNGRLTLHNVKVSPGPVAKQFAELIGANNVTLTLANEKVVKVVVDKGRVYHDGLELDIRGYKVTTSGSVGFDGTLDLMVNLPINTRLLEGVLKDRPLIQQSLANKTVALRMTGTLDNPKLDPNAFKAATDKLVKDAMGDAAKGALEGLFKPKK